MKKLLYPTNDAKMIFIDFHYLGSCSAPGLRCFMVVELLVEKVTHIFVLLSIYI